MGLADRGCMSATPTTTQLGPDQARLHELLRRLAEATSPDAPILSVYADVRPEAQGERPGERNELTMVRDRLRQIGDSLEPHDTAGESFAHDRDRIERLFATEDLNAVNGLAVFACHHIGLWEIAGSAAAFETRVAAGPTADLFQLARLLDESGGAVIGIVDTNTCRLFVTRRGALLERQGRDEPSEEHERTDVGGWSQARYQRHIDMQDKRFAKEAAQAIDDLVASEKPEHVILAGDERALSVLEPELSERVRALVKATTTIRMRAGEEEIHDEVAPILAALEEADGQAVADRAIAGHRAGDLGVVGIDATASALEMGQVDELVIDEAVPIDPELRKELVRQASLTDARVEVVREHEGLRRHEGVAATLRFRIEPQR
jgi:peptide chain release factor subunit 1